MWTWILPESGVSYDFINIFRICLFHLNELAEAGVVLGKPDDADSEDIFFDAVEELVEEVTMRYAHVDVTFGSCPMFV